MIAVASSCNSLLHRKFIPVLTEVTFDPRYSYCDFIAKRRRIRPCAGASGVVLTAATVSEVK